MFLVSPNAKQMSAFQETGKIGRTNIDTTMPKIQQKLIHNKETVPARQDIVQKKIIGKTIKTVTTIDTMKTADPNTIDTTPHNLPMAFGTENWTTISTQIGATALLPCTVHSIGEGVVSISFHSHTYTWHTHSPHTYFYYY